MVRQIPPSRTRCQPSGKVCIDGCRCLAAVIIPSRPGGRVAAPGEDPLVRCHQPVAAQCGGDDDAVSRVRVEALPGRWRGCRCRRPPGSRSGLGPTAPDAIFATSSGKLMRPLALEHSQLPVVPTSSCVGVDQAGVPTQRRGNCSPVGKRSACQRFISDFDRRSPSGFPLQRSKGEFMPSPRNIALFLSTIPKMVFGRSRKFGELGHRLPVLGDDNFLAVLGDLIHQLQAPGLNSEALIVRGPLGFPCPVAIWTSLPSAAGLTKP